MTSFGHHSRVASRIRWPRDAEVEPDDAGESGERLSLLDLDEDIAEECDPQIRVRARQLSTVTVREVEAGPCDLRGWFEGIGQGPGLLVLDGLIACGTCVGERTACELVGSGDLLQPIGPRVDELVAQEETCRVLWPTRLAVLDEEFAARTGRCPQVALVLLRRAGRRAAEVEALRAIACHPRLEVRLVLMLWHLGSRWGRVERDGIRLTLPLTHRLLGQLVAAERPSVTHALIRLAHAGMVTGAAGDLHLRGSLDRQLQTLLDRPAETLAWSGMSTTSALASRRSTGVIS